jgi:aminopeptidase N
MNEELRAAQSRLRTDVSIIMYSWTRQAGYPLVTVASEGNELTITQVPLLLTSLV